MKKLLKSGIFWTIIIGILGIIITFGISNKKREPVYLISKQPSLILDGNNPFPKIRLTANDTTEIKENVYVVSVKFWNNGKIEIKKNDVRKDFLISFSEITTILDYKIVQQTKPDVAKFSLQSEEEKVKVDWDYFDPGFGFEFQIIYASDSFSDLIFEGYVLGAEIKEVELRKISPVWVIFAIILSALSIGIIKEGIKSIADKEKDSGFVVIMGIVVFVISLLLIYASIWKGFTPPL